jgi:flagellar FliJ protein
MAQGFRLQPLLDRAQEEMEEATRRLGELVAEVQSQQQKLEMLFGYHREYQNKLNDAMRLGIQPDVWRNYSAFLSRLEQAINEQKRQVNQAEQNANNGQSYWVEQRNRVKAFEALGQRHNMIVQKKEAKQEQKAADEHAAKRFRKDN